MGETKTGKATFKVGSFLTLVLGFAALVAGVCEAGIGGLLTIPFFLIALFGALLGIIPFIGPFLYYYFVRWLFDVILQGIGISMPIATGLLFYSFLIFSIFYCFIVTPVFLLFTYLFLKRKRGK